LLTYSHASGRSIDEVVQQVDALLRAGYRAVRAQCLVPGLDEMYGVPRSGAAGDGVGLPFVEKDWSAEAYLRFVPKLFSALRDAVGPEPRLLHDAG
jgi:mannonate dehydratase